MTLVYLASAWLAGVYLGLATSTTPAALALALTLGACALTLGMIWWRRPPVRTALFCAAVAAFAVWRTILAQAPLAPSHVAHLNGATASLCCLVESEPEVHHGSQRLLLRVLGNMPACQTEGASAPAEGLLMVTTRRYPEYRYGDLVTFVGRLESPPEFDGFSYRAYLARQGVYSLSRYPDLVLAGSSQGEAWRAVLVSLRGAVGGQLARLLAEPHASLAAALLVGERANLPDDLVESFRVTGLSHVLAVSGWQVSLVVGLLGGIGGRLLRRHHRLNFLVAAFGVAAYALLTGASPAVARAALMGIAALLAVGLGRPRDGLSALALACLGLTAWHPPLLLDTGFQLSALATLGLIVLSPPLRPLVARLPGWMGEVLVMTVAAELAVLPVLAADFGQVSLVSLVANLAVVPLVPGAMEWSAFAVVLGALWAPLGQAAAALASLYLGVCVIAVQWLAALPFAAATVPTPQPPLLALYYLMLLLVADGGRRAGPLLAALRGRLPGRVPRRVLWLAGGAAILALAGLVVRPDGALRVSFLDVGQGDAILVRSPIGQQVLVDGGPDGVGVSNALGRRLPFGRKEIDLVVLSHAHDDHLLGLIDVLQSHRVRLVLQGPPPERPSVAYRRWAELLDSLAVPVVEARTGQTIDLGEGAWLHVAHAGEAWSGDDRDLNEASLALLVGRGAFAALMLGDGGPDVQRWLLDRGSLPPLVALKVPHHGAAGSVDERFLRTLAPQVAVISVGQNNRFAHPAAETLRALVPAEIYRTDLHGSVEVRIESDGSYRVERSR